MVSARSTFAALSALAFTFHNGFASAAATNATVTAISVYNTTTCTDTPSVITFVGAVDCTEGEAICSSNDDLGVGHHVTTNCTTDVLEFTKKSYNGKPFVLMQMHDDGCKELIAGNAIVSDGKCQNHPQGSLKATWSNGNQALTLAQYTAKDCSNDPLELKIEAKDWNKGECIQNTFKFYVSETNAPTPAPTKSSAVRAGTSACVAAVFAGLAFMFV